MSGVSARSPTDWHRSRGAVRARETTVYHVAVHFHVPAERRDDFIAAALEDGRNSAADEPGTRRFELITDETDPDQFYLNEAYDDAAAFQVHVDGPHFARFFELIKDYATGPTWLVGGTTVADPR